MTSSLSGYDKLLFAHLQSHLGFSQKDGLLRLCVDYWALNETNI